MTIKEYYDLTGGDYTDALERLMDDSLIRRLIMKFAEDENYTQLKLAVENHDIEGAFVHAHTLKGVAANLGFAQLQETTSQLAEQLRPKQEEANPQLLAKVDEAYALLMEHMGSL